MPWVRPFFSLPSPLRVDVASSSLSSILFPVIIPSIRRKAFGFFLPRSPFPRIADSTHSIPPPRPSMRPLFFFGAIASSDPPGDLTFVRLLLLWKGPFRLRERVTFRCLSPSRFQNLTVGHSSLVSSGFWRNQTSY